MQIIESSVLGLRAARHRLTSPNSSISVTLFPMIHVGEPDFYRQVYADAFSHDVALVEGVDSPTVRHLTTTYRWIEHSNLGLITQPSYPAADSVRARIVGADLSEEEFQTEWRKVPLWLRLMVLVVSPIIGLRRRLFSSRVSIASGLKTDDRLSRHEILSWDPQIAALQYCVIGARDARFVEHLNALLEQTQPDIQRIAVVFGATHMRGILAELRRHDFFSAEAEWQTVFSY